MLTANDNMEQYPYVWVDMLLCHVLSKGQQRRVEPQLTQNLLAWKQVNEPSVITHQVYTQYHDIDVPIIQTGGRV